MKLSTLYLTSFAFFPSFAFSAAVPDMGSRNETLHKRGGEVNYIANCIMYQNTWTPGDSYHVSHLAWYANSDNSQNGQQPDSLSNEYRDWSKGGEWLTWPGTQQNLYFADSGVTVQTHIDGDAPSKALYTGTGWAQRTSDGKVFNCFKDNGRQLFQKSVFPQSLVCNSMYWCV
ncbi:hypothetical protein M407DRAFT_27713 [Tulasnella calospora MUT 4182]|uniref:Uncharacterized protein n=1 Tax=Tulasnella calospora MUT 4182 TaxID=1051891 RepID=A0A0C3Q2M4_9AGAM|nr:hypothetical protein M407DRAFT_27713 [Tulasnella calospora MUT 4182]